MIYHVFGWKLPYIDVYQDDLLSDEWCYLQYKTSSTSWKYAPLVTVGDGIHYDINIAIPNNDDYNNDDSFEVRLGNNGTEKSQNCYFKNFQVFGNAYSSTANPSVYPTGNTKNTFMCHTNIANKKLMIMTKYINSKSLRITDNFAFFI